MGQQCGSPWSPFSLQRLLSDSVRGSSFPFQIAPDRHSTFKRDVAEIVGSPEHRLTQKTSVPRIVDAFPFGHWATSVVVATEALSRVPVPSAREHKSRRILILDQRRILRGFSWRLVPDRVVPVHTIVNLFADSCPYRHTVLVHETPTEQREEQSAFLTQHGQVLTVEFRLVPDGGDIPASPWSDHTQHIPGTQQGPPPDDPSNDQPGRRPTVAGPAQAARTRSRTPPQQCSCGAAPVDATGFRTTVGKSSTVKWSLDHIQHALPAGHLDLTPDIGRLLSSAGFACVTDSVNPIVGKPICMFSSGIGPAPCRQICFSLAWQQCGSDTSLSLPSIRPDLARHDCPWILKATLGIWVGKLLSEPAAHPIQDGGLETARIATRLFGGEWPIAVAGPLSSTRKWTRIPRRFKKVKAS